jgi:hypothetical protein
MGIHRETSGAILIDSLGRFLFQQRDNIPEILYPGMIGLFGGHREGNETFLECVVREIYEEISHFLRRNALRISSGTQGLILQVALFTVRFMLRTTFPLTNY